ncbi:unnamed protein product [Urochloa humidicola]
MLFVEELPLSLYAPEVPHLRWCCSGSTQLRVRGASTRQQVPWSRALTYEEAQPFLGQSFMPSSTAREVAQAVDPSYEEAQPFLGQSLPSSTARSGSDNVPCSLVSRKVRCAI